MARENNDEYGSQDFSVHIGAVRATVLAYAEEHIPNMPLPEGKGSAR